MEATNHYYATEANAHPHRSGNDYIALYDPAADFFVKLDVVGLNDARGLSLHGMDVVPSAEDPETLWVYLVNHRPPVDELDKDSSSSKRFADSSGSSTEANSPTAAALTHSEDPSIEIFTTRAGSNELRHIRTVADPVVLHSPNDVAGSPDGKEFWFTNDMKDVDGWKVG